MKELLELSGEKWYNGAWVRSLSTSCKRASFSCVKEKPMPSKTLSDFQKDVDAWIQQVGGGYWSPHVNLARIAEEVGELARILNHQYGPKPKKPDEQAQEMGEELADIIFAIICLANSEGIDLETSLRQVIDKVWVRDRNRYS